MKNIETQYMALFESEKDALFRFIYLKVSDRNEALDLTQETFVKLWSYIKDGNVTLRNMRAFLYRIARNNIIDYYRKKKSVSLDAMVEEGYDLAEEIQPDQETIPEILKLIPDLPPEHHEILLLRHHHDMSIPEIANILKISNAFASVKLYRAHSAL
ncbi:MAG: RNA polymerase sigma factor, partial [Minisyncoccia bacterium]